MEKRQASTKTTGPCKKIYKAVATTIHSISFRSQRPMSANANVSSPNHPGGRTTASPTTTRFFLKKQVASIIPRPGDVNIPLQTRPSIMTNEKEKMANSSVSPHSNGGVTMISSPKIIIADHSSTQGDKTGTPAKSQTAKPATVTMIAESERVKASVASGNAHPHKALSKKEAKPPVVSEQEKPKQRAETPPSNMIIVQSAGGGVNAIDTPRIETAGKPHMPVQESQPKLSGQPAASVVKVTAKQDEPNHGAEGKQGKRPEHGGVHDHNHTYSDYIEYVKNQLRTESNVAEEMTAETPATRTATRRDSFDDRVSNFITRAKKNVRTTSNVGD